MLENFSAAIPHFASITVNIDPVFLHIGHFNLGWYGVAIAAAIAVAITVVRHEGRRLGLDPDAVLSVAMWAIAGGFIGARLLFLIDHWSTYVSDPLASFAVVEGGLAIEGALLGGTLAAVIAARRMRLPVLILADAAAPAVLLGQAIGRLGCLVTGDALGAATSLPWGVSYINPGAMAREFGVPLQPVFAYEALWDLAVLGLLWTLRTRIQQLGRLFALYLGLYALGKFGLTFLREERVWALGLQEAQFLAMILFVGAIAFWVLSRMAPTVVTSVRWTARA